MPAGTLSDEITRVLIVDSQGDHAQRVAAALAEVEDGGRLDLDEVGTVAEVPARIASGAADVVVLPLPQPDHEGVLPALELRASAPETPLVVLCRPEYEPIAIKAVQLGASDYLLSDRLYGTLVSRCLRHAVEVERVRARLARHDARWTSALRGDGGTDLRAASLRESLPEGFDKLVAEYRRALDRSIERALRPDAPHADHDVAKVARRAGRMGASPRDVIEIHTVVMKAREGEEGPQRARLVRAEGRLRLLELMGHLVTYYRDRLGVTRPASEVRRRPPAGGR